MITCLYCGYECPENAQICPNCGKPLLPKTAAYHTPDSSEIKEEPYRQTSDREKMDEKNLETRSIIIACIVLLAALLLYKLL